VTDRQRLVDQVIRHEGIRLTVYLDSLGVPTIGIGRNIRDKGITSAEALALLDHDLDECIADLSGAFPWFLDLDAVRQRVLVDLRFQLGSAGIRGFRKMLAACGRGDFTAASHELLASHLAEQTPNRAIELAGMLHSGEEIET